MWAVDLAELAELQEMMEAGEFGLEAGVEGAEVEDVADIGLEGFGHEYGAQYNPVGGAQDAAGEWFDPEIVGDRQAGFGNEMNPLSRADRLAQADRAIEPLNTQPAPQTSSFKSFMGPAMGAGGKLIYDLTRSKEDIDKESAALKAKQDRKIARQKKQGVGEGLAKGLFGINNANMIFNAISGPKKTKSKYETVSDSWYYDQLAANEAREKRTTDPYNRAERGFLGSMFARDVYGKQDSRHQNIAGYNYMPDMSSERVGIYLKPDHSDAYIATKGTTFTMSQKKRMGMDLIDDIMLGASGESKNMKATVEFAKQQMHALRAMNNDMRINGAGHSLGGHFQMMLQADPEVGPLFNHSTILAPGHSVVHKLRTTPYMKRYNDLGDDKHSLSHVDVLRSTGDLVSKGVGTVLDSTDARILHHESEGMKYLDAHSDWGEWEKADYWEGHNAGSTIRQELRDSFRELDFSTEGFKPDYGGMRGEFDEVVAWTHDGKPIHKRDMQDLASEMYQQLSELTPENKRDMMNHFFDTDKGEASGTFMDFLKKIGTERGVSKVVGRVGGNLGQLGGYSESAGQNATLVWADMANRFYKHKDKLHKDFNKKQAVWNVVRDYGAAAAKNILYAINPILGAYFDMQWQMGIEISKMNFGTTAGTETKTAPGFQAPTAEQVVPSKIKGIIQSALYTGGIASGARTSDRFDPTYHFGYYDYIKREWMTHEGRVLRPDPAWMQIDPGTSTLDFDPGLGRSIGHARPIPGQTVTIQTRQMTGRHGQPESKVISTTPLPGQLPPAGGWGTGNTVIGFLGSLFGGGSGNDGSSGAPKRGE